MTDSHDAWRELNPVPSIPKRAALYARAATVSQADGSSSIPDQLRACIDFCQERGWQISGEYIDAGMSGRDDNRPEFQRMMNDAIRGVPGFGAIVVYDHSRFFRDSFLGEMYRRRLLKAGVELVSIKADDRPNADLIHKFISLIDELSAKEHAKRTLRGMEENARRGFINGPAPFGYRVVIAQSSGAKVRKRFEIEPSEAEIVRLIFRLASSGPTGSGPTGSGPIGSGPTGSGPTGSRPASAMAIAKKLRLQNIRTRSDQLFSSGAVRDILRRTTYIGRHLFNVTEKRTKQEKPPEKRIIVWVPAIIDEATFEAVQAAMQERRIR